MASILKAVCPQCRTKYRLPAEAAGRSARCKVCQVKFRVPKPASLDDSVVMWLDDNAEDEPVVSQPRVITTRRHKLDPPSSAGLVSGFGTHGGSSSPKPS